MKKKLTTIAFTLAETLIVIGILGVVAALTLPNLNHAMGDKEKVTRVQKAYSEMSEAVDRAIAVYGPIEEWPDIATCKWNEANDCAQMFAGRILGFMKVSKNCGYDQHNGTCFMKDLATNQLVWTGTRTSKGWYVERRDMTHAVLSQGVSLSIGPESRIIYVDVDGPLKGKNAWGDDLHLFGIDKVNGVYPKGPDITSNTTLPCNSENDTCTKWIIEFGNMDYKKTSDGKTCPNGKVLDWTTNTSCN